MPLSFAAHRHTAPTGLTPPMPAEAALLEFPQARPAQALLPSQVMLDSFLLGAVALAEGPGGLGWLRAGNRLGLRTAGPGRVEVCAPDDSVLGRLPPEDAQEVVALMNAGARPTARVRCVVPAFRAPRVQLSIEVGAQVA